MKLILIILTCILLMPSNYSQQNPGARQIALSNSDIAQSDDVFSVFNNPAGIGQIRWREIGVFYSPEPFGLSELANAFAAYNEPFNFGSVAIGVMTYGFELYRESKVTIGFSYKNGDNIYFGTAINYQAVSIKNYGSKNSFLFDIGLLAYMTDDLRIGFSYKNITRSSYGFQGDELPVVLNSGLSYQIIKNCNVNIAIEKDIRFPVSPRFGIEYQVIKQLTIRTGYSKEPVRYSFGVGINISIFRFNYALLSHQQLGMTHQIGLIVSFNGSITDEK